MVNDELKDDILRHHQYGSDDEEEEEDDDDDQFNGAKKRLPGYYKSIDWDDEDLDEDLKYLKILKFVKYKSNDSLQKFRKSRNPTIILILMAMAVATVMEFLNQLLLPIIITSIIILNHKLKLTLLYHNYQSNILLQCLLHSHHHHRQRQL